MTDAAPEVQGDLRAELQAELAEALDRAAKLQRRLDAVQALLAEERALAAEQAAGRTDYEEAAALRDELAALRAQLGSAQKELRAIRASSTWRAGLAVKRVAAPAPPRPAAARCARRSAAPAAARREAARDRTTPRTVAFVVDADPAAAPRDRQVHAGARLGARAAPPPGYEVDPRRRRGLDAAGGPGPRPRRRRRRRRRASTPRWCRTTSRRWPG